MPDMMDDVRIKKKIMCECKLILKGFLYVYGNYFTATITYLDVPNTS